VIRKYAGVTIERRIAFPTIQSFPIFYFDKIETLGLCAIVGGHFQIFRLIILPQVLRSSVPALTNQCIGNLKDSSVAFLIEYTEFFARVQELASTNFQFFKAYLFAAIVYLLLVSVIVVAARELERRMWLPGLGR
jgi:ABC-type amino acid transport system permease subunit